MHRTRGRLSAALVSVLGLTCAQAAPPQTRLIVYDNDFYGAVATDVLPLLGDRSVKVLGFTVVTGDGWVDEETSGLLRFLEIAGRSDIPVVKGALYPLVNSQARTSAWEQAYGRIVWKGAWNEAASGAGSHPADPHAVPPSALGPPTVKATPGVAAEFLIAQVHRYPYQVTILAAGPLTNLALAIRLDPEFAGLAHDLVFMGGFVDTNLQQVTASANFATDFNIWFDPEAADIVLTAPWAKITSVGAVGNDISMTPNLRARIAAKSTPVTRLIATDRDSLPLWDQLAAAIAVDPSLVTQETEAWMDVDVDHGMYYGATHVWPGLTTPHLGERKVHIVRAVDTGRFLRGFVAAAQSSFGR